MNKIIIAVLLISLCSCGPQRYINQRVKKFFNSDSALQHAHVGISIYEPSTKKNWYQLQADKYFVPASNVKIFTTYAALKYLGNRLKGLKYEEHDNTIVIEGTADPTLLHPDFKNQAVFNFLKNRQHILINTENWSDEKWGRGWSWDDYNDDYMAQRSALPVYGNVVRISINKEAGRGALITPGFFKDSLVYDDENRTDSFDVQRRIDKNIFEIKQAEKKFTAKEIPYETYGFETTRKLLKDTLKCDIRASNYILQNPALILSYPTDSVLKPMMHRSDNFLAEQLLMMVSNEVLGKMNDAHIINHLLNTDLKNLPQRPQWVDGSGLSRYNLFTPSDFIYTLEKLKEEFGMERMKLIFTAGNEGSLKNYYQNDSSFIYAKTGSMTGVVALSGYLFTHKNRMFIFSVLVNHHTVTATRVRRAVEEFLTALQKKY